MHWLIGSLRQHPEAAFFLVLALGYGLGGLRLGKFTPGPPLGVLIAGIAVGQFDVPTSDSLKYSFFMLCLFAIGYRNGPQFFHSLRATGLRQVALTLIVCTSAIATSAAVSRLAGFDAGASGGLYAGAIAGSPAFAAVGDALGRLDVPEARLRQVQENASVAFAVSYLIGMVLAMWLLASLGPRLLRVDLAESCRELEREMGVPREGGGGSTAGEPFTLRAYEVPGELDGRQVSELESGFKGHRVFVEHLSRGGSITIPDRSEPLRAGDRVALWGRREALVNADGLSGHEVDDRELLAVGIVSLDIVVTRREAGRDLGEIANGEAARGVLLRKLVRAGRELPYTLKTPVEQGDVLTVTGEGSHVGRLAGELGYAVRPTDATDMTKVSATVFVGALAGLPALALSGVEIGLTLFVGVLLGGLTLGWLSSLYPAFGKTPEPALWVFESLGLTGFLAAVGLQAGPGFFPGLRESGGAFVICAVLVVTVPNLLGVLAGRYLLRMHPGIVLGACAGAGTSTPALGAVLGAARSRVPALSFGVCYALGNAILALGGSLLVRMIGTR